MSMSLLVFFARLPETAQCVLLMAAAAAVSKWKMQMQMVVVVVVDGGLSDDGNPQITQGELQSERQRIDGSSSGCRSNRLSSSSSRQLSTLVFFSKVDILRPFFVSLAAKE